MPDVNGLRIAPGLLIPEEAVTQTFGILAKRGAGKSNAAAVMAEEMHRVGLQFVAVDPVGAWWGLRSSADGKGPGLPIPVLGGYHGDVPLEPGAGELVADLVVDARLSCVIDVSAFASEGEKRRFLIALAERLFRQKGRPGHEEPLHLFLEEADDYAPQRASGVEMNRCLGAFQRIVKRGRARGLGATMISQRSAALNKDLLTQIDTLIVLRTTSPNDRKAIEGWVTYHDVDDAIISSLSELRPGEAWVWSPEFLELVKRVQIRRRSTFDSGATPKAGAKRRAPATLADVDLGALEARMKETIERAKAEDPKELHRQIRELKQQLAKRPTETKVETVTETVEVPVLTVIERDHLERTIKAADEARDAMDALLPVVRDILVRQGMSAWPLPAPRPAVRRERSDQGQRSGEPAAGLIRPLARDDFGKGERKVLSVLRQWPEGRTQNELAFLAGYSAKASTIGVILSKLRGAGLVEQGQPIRLTLAGVDAAGGYLELPSGQELLDHWRRHPRMGSGERAVLDVLVEHYPNDLSHDELATITGYSPIASTLGVILSKLRKLGLVEERRRRLAPEFAEAIGR